MRCPIVLAVVAVVAGSGAQAQALAAPLPAGALNAATAPPLVCPNGSQIEGGRPPAATIEVCKRPDGKKEGGFRQWSDDGSLKLAGQYRDDQAEGPWRGWYPNGGPQFIGGFAAGQWSGVWNYWGPDGQRKADVTYRDGRDVTSEPATRALRPAVTPAELQAEADADRAAEARRDAELAARAAEQADFDRRYEEDATRAQGQRRARVAAAWDAQRDHTVLGATQFVADNGVGDVPDGVFRILRDEIQDKGNHLVVRVGKTRWWFAKAPASAFDEFVRCGLHASHRAAAVDWAHHACRPMGSNPREGATTESTAVKLDDKTWIVLTEAPKFFEAICSANGVELDRLRAAAERKARVVPATKIPVSGAWLDSKLDHKVWPVSPVACSLGKK